MRTKEQGALTSADVALVFGVTNQLREAAHWRVMHSLNCDACKAMQDALGTWLAAHQVSEEELREAE